MLALLKLLQSLAKALHSDGTPGQVGAGVALGAALGLTPLVSAHNAVVVALVLVLNVSVPGALLGTMVFAPAGFLLDPLFDRVGRHLLLDTPALAPLWARWYDTPLVPFTSFNNTVVLGSFVCWAAAFGPILLAARAGVARYRATVGERVRRSPLYRAVTASRAYNAYRWFSA